MARGDRSGDGALDASEIRSMVPSSQFTVNPLSSLSGELFLRRLHRTVEPHSASKCIDDLRLAPRTTQEAKRLASAFADEFEGAALANLRTSVAPLLTEPQRAKFEADVTQFQALQASQRADNSGPRPSVLIAALAGVVQVTRQGPAQMRIVSAAVEKFRVDQQLDDARRSALVSRLNGLLTEEESDNLRAALARRPLVKRPSANFHVTVSCEHGDPAPEPGDPAEGGADAGERRGVRHRTGRPLRGVQAMRYLCKAFAMLIVSAAAASAQSFVVLNPPTRAAMAGGDVVVDRLMSFNRDRDGVSTAAELSERMQGLVARGDRSGDGALDAYEIRLMASSSPFGVNSLSSLSGELRLRRLRWTVEPHTHRKLDR